MAWPKGVARPDAFQRKEMQEQEEKQEVVRFDKLNIGCGPSIKEGYINIDKADFADLQLDLEDAVLPFSDNSISEIIAEQVLEHIHNFIPLMNELHRVLKPMGSLKITVPHVPYLEAFQDPTHVRFFTDRSFCYFHEQDALWIGTGKTYDILPFRHLIQTEQGWILKTTLIK